MREESSLSLRTCTKCVMDTTDPSITFDEFGICDHCHGFEANVKPQWHPNKEGKDKLKSIVAKIRKDGENRDFDCIMGMSGGADSSYLLHLAVKELGLRPLVFHVDGGWNSDIAVNNINVMIDKLGLDLYTEVINWAEMRDFQLAYFKAGVPNLDVPQDHAFVATLYDFAKEHKIKYILNGGNIATECVRNPLEWIYHGTDMRQIRDIIKKFGTVPMKTYPFSGVLRHKLYLRYLLKVQVVKPLDYIEYIKNDAMNLLAREYDWQPYPQKHFESRFTRFYEGYWLPKKFGYDTRKVQYSSMIQTGQMNRDSALENLATPAMSEADARIEFEYVATKLGISIEELKSFLNAPNKTHRDYKNQEFLFTLGARALQLLGIEKAIKR